MVDYEGDIKKNYHVQAQDVTIFYASAHNGIIQLARFEFLSEK